MFTFRKNLLKAMLISQCNNGNHTNITERTFQLFQPEECNTSHNFYNKLKMPKRALRRRGGKRSSETICTGFSYI